MQGGCVYGAERLTGLFESHDVEVGIQMRYLVSPDSSPTSSMDLP
jgi:hypothetical protein